VIPDDPDKKVVRGLSIFLGLFILMGLVLLGAGAWNLVRSVRCESWPTVAGVILSSQMERQRGHKGGATYSASIDYDYVVAGTHYDGTRVAFGSMSASAAYAQAILHRFPVGKKMPVYYSPGDPQDAVLEPGIHGGTWICFGVGTLFVLAGLMFRQISLAVLRPPPDAVPGVGGGGAVGMQKPPVLMGVVFILAGSFVAIGATTSGSPKWLIWTIGGAFILAGLFLLKKSLEKDEVD
jgi:hypothetical protein